MKIIWLGHSGFRIEIGGKVLLVDPWLAGNPVFPEGREAEATEGATHICLTHGHGDHASNTLSIARERGIPVLCIHEIAQLWGNEDGVEVMGFGKGGTIDLDGVSVTMTHAIHSSSLDFTGEGLQYAGDPAGFVIRGEGHSIYVSGDTDVMADMEVIADRYKPDIGILCAGGHFTMDMEGAAYAANRYFDFKIVIPCHYKTFPLLAQDAEPLRARLPVGTRLIEPEVLEPITI
jgi:L-ascorbate metabolism protein UlaG (beta-lactamase superfamily)